MIEKLKNLAYPIYDFSYYGLPDKSLYLLLFNTIPSEHITHLLFKEEIFNYFLNKNFVYIAKHIDTKEDKSSCFDFLDDQDETLLMNENEKQLINIKYRKTINNNKLYDFVFLFDINTYDFKSSNLVNDLKSYIFPHKKYNIHLIKSMDGSLSTEGYEFNISEVDLELNYGAKFIPVHNKIISRLNNDGDKGIVLLHGKPGTGKTNYLRHLTKQIKNKDILFIPPSMTEILTDPNIIPFLMEHKNSILIIEDGEKIIRDRNINGASVGVSNILNLTDGIMGDCLNIQIIITFNQDRSLIDKAITRKGRLIAEHKFDVLDVDETNKLFKVLGKNTTSAVGLTLADIYNFEDETYTNNNMELNIGFKIK